MPLPGVLHNRYAWPLRVIHHPHTANFYISIFPGGLRPGGLRLLGYANIILFQSIKQQNGGFNTDFVLKAIETALF